MDRKVKIFIMASSLILIPLAAAIWIYITINSVTEPSGPLSVGDYIEFGEHEWQILYIEEDRMLLISRHILSIRQFDETQRSVNWERSCLRHWLNDDFYLGFSEDQQERIVLTHLPNSQNPWFDSDSGWDTYDKIFALSAEEVVRYFGDSGELEEKLGSGHFIDDEFNYGRRAYHDRYGYMHWFTRTMGFNNTVVVVVTADGRIFMFGGSDYMFAGVRPAMWIFLEDEM